MSSQNGTNRKKGMIMNSGDKRESFGSRLGFPVGTLIYVLLCCTGFDNFLEKTNTGKVVHISKRLRPYLSYLPPVIIFIILIQSPAPLFSAI